MFTDSMDQKFKKIMLGIACLLHDVQSFSWDESNGLV